MTKILVAEDDKFIGKAYLAKLTKLGFDTKVASDGEEALEILKTFLPDIILLDLVMPKKDGFATLTSIKSDPKLKDIPVLVASNLGQSEDISRALSLGAKDYVVKSDMNLSDIINKVTSWIK